MHGQLPAVTSHDRQGVGGLCAAPVAMRIFGGRGAMNGLSPKAPAAVAFRPKNGASENSLAGIQRYNSGNVHAPSDAVRQTLSSEGNGPLLSFQKQSGFIARLSD
jgi:hypothetical protein